MIGIFFAKSTIPYKDHDGDTITTNVLLGTESTEEVRDYFNRAMSMVDASGKLVYGLSSGRLIRYSVRAATHHKLSK